jgi:hypothetical protein
MNLSESAVPSLRGLSKLSLKERQERAKAYYQARKAAFPEKYKEYAAKSRAKHPGTDKKKKSEKRKKELASRVSSWEKQSKKCYLCSLPMNGYEAGELRIVEGSRVVCPKCHVGYQALGGNVETLKKALELAKSRG